MPYRTAFLIGVFQILSLLPGTSRSGATIIGGLLLGVSRSVAADFTCFLGIQIMFGASLLKIVKIFAYNSISLNQIGILLVACLVAFGGSMLAIRCLMGYVKKHDFTFFGKYRIVLGIVLLVYAGFHAIFS